MATTNKWNGNGQRYSREDDTEFFNLFSAALEESIRSDIEYWIEVQRKALISVD